MSTGFFSNVKNVIKKYGVFYAIGLIIAFALKLYYSRANIDDLDWILAPTTRWLQLLCGISFEKESGIGYVNHNYKFVIAPVCAGINFMIIAFTTLIFSFVHHMKTIKCRIIWMISSLVIIYPYTILVNSLRIIPSIYLLQMDFYGGWLTPERVHTMEGTLVYFAALLFLYSVADKIAKRFSVGFSPESSKEEYYMKPAYYKTIKWFLPVFFYFSITLGIPFLNGAYRNDTTKFLEYALLVSGVCFSVIAVFCLSLILAGYFRRKIAKVGFNKTQ